MMIDISIEHEPWQQLGDVIEMVERALDHAGRAVAERIPDGAEVSVVLSDNATVKQLNAQWRGQDKATNVLSFASNDADGPLSPLLGDIILAFETLERECHEQDKSLPDHLSHLVVHGFLHLLGYDHIADDEAETMEDMERSILASLGIADPYLAS